MLFVFICVCNELRQLSTVCIQIDVIQVRLRENWRLCELYKKSSELHHPCCTLFPTGKREIKLLVTVVLTSMIIKCNPFNGSVELCLGFTPLIRVSFNGDVN